MSNPSKTPIWRLRTGADRRFKSGHPWVYSNELMDSPKWIAPGAPVELRDSGGKFLGRGYGNPSSLISFRTLSRDPELMDPWSADHLLRAIQSAAKVREGVGLLPFSHRLVFGESDFLPGLVIDRYRTSFGQVFVIQAHSAGADRWMSVLPEVLERYVKEQVVTQSKAPTWDQTIIVSRNDLGVRKMEELKEEEPKIIKSLQKNDSSLLRDARIQIKSALSLDPIEFHVDLYEGQKTGFFLDQAANIELTALRFKGRNIKRILDLCCYVGQWGTQLARVFKDQGVEVVAVDSSAAALAFARINIEAQGASCETMKGDVLKDLADLPAKSFDLVISDPPALIKNRKDIPTGKHAYLQLNTQAMRLVKDSGAFVSCSCSGLLEEEEFANLLSRAAQRNSLSMRWVGRGASAPDHPMRSDFPEGRYLKGWMGLT